MAENTNIEWCHHTFNPWRGCTKVSPGCANCYADQLSARNPTTLGIWGPHGTRIVASHSMWNQPVKWNSLAEHYYKCTDCGIEQFLMPSYFEDRTPGSGCNFVRARQRVFCASLGDVFEDWGKAMRYPAIDEDTKKPTTGIAWWRNDKGLIKGGQTTANLTHGERLATMQDARNQLFTLIEATPNLDWLLLTKRPENVLRMVPAHWRTQFPANVWMGTSVENQAMADKRIPELLKVPAPVRFLSCEPLLGPVEFAEEWLGSEAWRDASIGNDWINWVIAGGESGPGARPMHPAWATSLQQQCEAAAVPFLFKQWGNWFPRSQWEFNPHIVLPDDSNISDGQEKLTQNQDRLYYLENEFFHNIGKLKAGRLLHGHEHNGYPKSHLPTP